MSLFTIDEEIKRNFNEVYEKVFNDEYEKLVTTGLDDKTAYDKAYDLAISEAVKSIDGLKLEKNHKLENFGLWIKELVAEQKALSDEIKSLMARKKVKERKEEALRNYILNYLQGEIFETTKVKFSYRSSESVEVDESILLKWAQDNEREEFLRYKSPEVDKVELKKALKLGEIVPGAEIVKNISLQVK